MIRNKIISGNVLDGSTWTVIPDASVHTVITSPPYWGLRDYDVDGQLGLEPTPQEYIERMVSVFRHVHRVLRDDGTLWLNMGDSYNTLGGHTTIESDGRANRAERSKVKKLKAPGLKTKDLCGMPWRVALALQADGWYLRQDIIWNKPNPMPESVRDRCTKAHEYIFLLTKKPRYYYDAEAISEPVSGTAHTRGNGVNPKASKTGIGWGYTGDKTQGPTKPRAKQNASFSAAVNELVPHRNKRSVWTIPTQSYSEAHFATFPEKLIEPCILAGTSEKGCCTQCGAPLVRQTETIKTFESGSGKSGNAIEGKNGPDMQGGGDTGDIRKGPVVSRSTTGWVTSCECSGVDLTIMESPTGQRAGDDPSKTTGRAGMNRPRGEKEGRRPITRYEQNQYAIALRGSPHRKDMESEAGDAFSHYIRTDKSGARPIPGHLLEKWIDDGWLSRVEIPQISPPEPVPCIVLDPFLGSGTVAAVARKLGRDYIGIELNAEYIELALDRIGIAEHPTTYTKAPAPNDSPLFPNTTPDPAQAEHDEYSEQYKQNAKQ